MFITEYSAQNIVNEMKMLLGRDINIMNEEGKIIASTNMERIGLMHEGAQILIKNNLDELIIEPNEMLKNTIPGINLPIKINGKIKGVIGVTGASEEIIKLSNVIKRMTELIIENLQQKEDMTLMEDARGRFVESWLFSDSQDITDLETRGKLLDIDVRCPRYVMVIELLKRTPKNETQAVNELQSSIMLKRIRTYVESNKSNLCFSINRRILILLQEQSKQDVEAVAVRITKAVSEIDDYECYVGISEKPRSRKEIRKSYDEAKFACNVAARTEGRRIIFYGGADLEFVAQCLHKEIKKNVVEAVYSNCTKAEQNELYETLSYYFAYDGNIREAADALFIHRNTFQYRLNKVEEKTGLSVKKSRESFLLYLATLYIDQL